VVVASVDALLGSRLILIGLLVAGPAVAAVSLRPRPTAAISAMSVVLAIALGAPDHIWLTNEHFIWIGAVAVVSLANTALVAVIAPHLRLRAEPDW
jgi:hypothetical protein